MPSTQVRRAYPPSTALCTKKEAALHQALPLTCRVFLQRQLPAADTPNIGVSQDEAAQQY